MFPLINIFNSNLPFFFFSGIFEEIPQSIWRQEIQPVQRAKTISDGVEPVLWKLANI